MPLKTAGSPFGFRTALFAFLTLLMPFTASAQPIQLLKDLEPGVWQDDAREVVQVTTTTDSIYMVSRRWVGYGSNSQEYLLNSSNGVEPERRLGQHLGESTTMGGPSPAMIAEHPFFALRDGKAVFPQVTHLLGSRYMELDGQTGDVLPLTGEMTGHPPLATWLGVDGHVFFVRRSFTASSWEVCRLNSSIPEGAEVTASIPFSLTAPYYYLSTGPACVLGHVLIFTTYEDETKTVKLFRTDGSSSGTQLLYTYSSESGIQLTLVKALGKCFFGHSGHGGQYPLYVTDGTPGGTQPVDVGLADPFDFHLRQEYAETSSTLYWVSTMGYNNIYASDGLTTRTLPNLPDSQYSFNGRYRPESIHWIDNHLYITAINNQYWNRELFVSDGYSTPTAVHSAGSLFSDIRASAPTTSGSLVYATNGIYRVKGNMSNAVMISNCVPGEDFFFPGVWPFQGKAVFNARISGVPQTDQVYLSNPLDIWSPTRLTEFTQTPKSSDPTNYIKAGNRTFFNHGRVDYRSSHPPAFRTDGTAGGTIEAVSNDVEWLGVTPEGPIFYYDHRPYEGAPYYGDGVVYVTKGDVGGGLPTALTYGNYSYGEKPPTRLFEIGNNSYVGGSFNDLHSWFIKTNGTPEGTQQLHLSFHEPFVEYPLYPIGVAGSTGLFAARTTNTATIIHQVWSTDGTQAGTVQISESAGRPTEGAALPDGRIVYGATTPANGFEVMISDGTASGTSLLKDINPGVGDSSPSHFTSAGGRVYFFTDSPTSAGTTVDLWVTNGTPSGTLIIETSEPPFLKNDVLTLKNSQHGGVYILGTINGGTESHSPANYQIIYSSGDIGLTRVVALTALDAKPKLLEEVNGFMYLALTTASQGRELYRTRGFTGGIDLVQDFAPGKASGAVMEEAAVIGNRLLFSADPGNSTTGRELHYIDVLDSKVDDWQLY